MEDVEWLKDWYLMIKGRWIIRVLQIRLVYFNYLQSWVNQQMELNFASNRRLWTNPPKQWRTDRELGLGGVEEGDLLRTWKLILETGNNGGSSGQLVGQLVQENLQGPMRLLRRGEQCRH